jgi:hypothetical protein
MVTDLILETLSADFFFEFLEFLIVLFIAFYSYKAYKITEKKRYLYFTRSFLCFSVSFFIAALVNYLSAEEWISSLSPWVKITMMNSFYDVGLLLQSLFFIAGLVTLAILALDIKEKREMSLLLFISLIAVALSVHFRLATHFIALLFLIYILPNFYQNCRKTKSSNAKIVFVGFSLFFFSQFLFLFVFQMQILWFYFIAHLLQLAGFSLLLVSLIKILRK